MKVVYYNYKVLWENVRCFFYYLIENNKIFLLMEDENDKGNENRT